MDGETEAWHGYPIAQGYIGESGCVGLGSLTLEPSFLTIVLSSLCEKQNTIKEQSYVCVGALCNPSLGGGCGDIRKGEIFLEGLVSEQS